MTEQREELKGKLLLLWLDDLKNDRKPGVYPEMQMLAPAEIEEVMSLARFVKTTFFPSETPQTSLGEYASRLARRVFRERDRLKEANRVLAAKSVSFGELVRTAMVSQGIDRIALLDSLGLPATTLTEIEAGRLPPHRLPVDRMVRLLTALSLAFREVIDAIRNSSLRWANTEYSKTQTQLGRLDVAMQGDERRKLMQDNDSLDDETERIEFYCAQLSKILP